MPWDQAIAHREAGRRLGDAGHLEKAREIFARIGATRDP
jgi:hypothetical protein